MMHILMMNKISFKALATHWMMVSQKEKGLKVEEPGALDVVEWMKDKFPQSYTVGSQALYEAFLMRSEGEGERPQPKQGFEPYPKSGLRKLVERSEKEGRRFSLVPRHSIPARLRALTDEEPPKTAQTSYNVFNPTKVFLIAKKSSNIAVVKEAITTLGPYRSESDIQELKNHLGKIPLGSFMFLNSILMNNP
jgi:hypothetical protein